tara:strand:- start:1271 stop:1720 length:450 start_codon:yes stop_codon:yes gene_type:complete
MNVTRLEGWKGVQKDLAKLPYLIDQKKFFIAAFRKVGGKVKNAAKSNVPVKDGILKKHIKVFATRAGRKQGFVTIGVKFKTSDKWDDGPHYASKVEYGTSETAAQPYMRPAYDQTKSIVKSEMIGACKAIVGKAIKGLNKGKRYYEWKI